MTCQPNSEPNQTEKSLYYVVHTSNGRPNIVEASAVVADALDFLKKLDFSEFTKNEMIRRYVDAMNAAYCKGKIGSAREPSEDEVLRLAGLAFALCSHVGA